MVQENFLNNSLPEHINAEALLYIWLVSVGPKSELNRSLDELHQQFADRGYEINFQDLLAQFANAPIKYLEWASTALIDFLPNDLREQLLTDVLTYLSKKEEVWSGQFYILEFLIHLFQLDAKSSQKRIEQTLGIELKEFLNESRIKKEKETAFLISPLRQRGIIDALKKNLGLEYQYKFRSQPSELPDRKKLHKKLDESENPTQEATQQKNQTNSVKSAPNASKQKINGFWIGAGIISLFILFIIFIHNSNKEQFLSELEQEEVKLEKTFNEYKEIKEDQLFRNDKVVYREFKRRFEASDAIVTDYKEFGLNKYPYTYPSLAYLSCLEKDIISEIRSEENKNKIDQQILELKSRFGDAFTNFYENLKEENTVATLVTNEGCDSFFKSKTFYVFESGKWASIKQLLEQRENELKRIQEKNAVAERNFRLDKDQAIRALNYSYRQNFQNALDSNMPKILYTKDIEIPLESGSIGNWTQPAEEVIYNDSELQKILDQALINQWKNNSLYTGQKPYSMCFTKNNSCSGYSCSQIEVTAGNQDVVVSIKNNYGTVVRHAYINSRDEYTFELPNGQYQTFFYYGTGWNPNKDMNSNTCRNLTGGFVTNETFSKDPDKAYLNNHILTYQLYEQTNGNFRTGASSANEAF